MAFNKELAKKIGATFIRSSDETGLENAFADICEYLSPDPDLISWRGVKPSFEDENGLAIFAEKYFAGYRKSDFPAQPGTVPDEMVSIVLRFAYGYNKTETDKMKIEHQHAMCAENSVGGLLERYLDTHLRQSGWRWCCGDFVKAVDFIKFDNNIWHALQIKNRSNSENSSSSAIRSGTDIQKWFRTDSKTGNTRWDKLPSLMQGVGLTEKGFIDFAESYLKAELTIRRRGTQ